MSFRERSFFYVQIVRFQLLFIADGLGPLRSDIVLQVDEINLVAGEKQIGPLGSEFPDPNVLTILFSDLVARGHYAPLRRAITHPAHGDEIAGVDRAFVLYLTRWTSVDSPLPDLTYVLPADPNMYFGFLGYMEGVRVS